MESSCLMGIEFRFGKMKRILEIGCEQSECTEHY